MGSTAEKSFNPKDYAGKIYLNGEYVVSRSKSTFSLKNPKDGSVVVEGVPICNAEDVDHAVAAAEEALHGPWSKFTGQQRAACLQKLAALLEDQLMPILTLDSSCILYYSGWTDKLKGDYFPADDGFIKFVRHEPVGVCAAINAFNSPIGVMMLKLAPCLATGNVMIVKQSEKTPLGALALAPLFEQAGIPKGVVQVISGDGSTGALLASHMRIRKISFTGSIPTGKKVQVAAAQSNLKRVTLEMGGKSPALVFEDCDLDNALTWTINAILPRSGQVCVAASRVYVQKSISEQFIQKYTERMKAAAEKLGDPQDMATVLGPLVDEAQFERVRGMIDRGRQEAELIVGGVRHGETGYFIEPTVFLNPRPDAEIYKKEIFGPVAIVKTFETEEEALRMANDSEYGLMSGVFTSNISRAMRVSSMLDSGVVGVNCVSFLSMQAPFGGRKQSGIGRELGEYALRAYTEPKTVLINMNV